MNEFNNYTKQFFLVFLLSFFASFAFGLADESVSQDVSSQSSLHRFVDYLENITTVLAQDEGVSEEKIAYMRTHVALTKQWVERISATIVQGAFATSPLIIKELNAVFDDIDSTQWPTLSLMKKWSSAMDQYKKFLLAAYIPALSSSLNRQLDSDSVNAIMGLYNELTRSVFTKKFFDFSTLETVLDTIFVRPVEFTKAHPYIVAGTILTIVVVGGGCYWYITKEQRAWKQWMRDEDALLIRGKQGAADCAVWSMYRAWCHQEAAGDVARYEVLACDQETYGRFREVVADILTDQARRDRARRIPNRARITDWLANGQVRDVLDVLQQRAGENLEFGIENRPFHAESYEQLEPAAIEGDGVRDRETGRVYAPDEIPADRIEFCVPARNGIRYAGRIQVGLDDLGEPIFEPGDRDRIEAFQDQPGNVFDFIINTNRIPRQDRGANPIPARGHFFHIRAINDPDAEEGVRFIVSETANPDREFLSGRLADIRNMLRPYED